MLYISFAPYYWTSPEDIAEFYAMNIDDQKEAVMSCAQEIAIEKTDEAIQQIYIERDGLRRKDLPTREQMGSYHGVVLASSTVEEIVFSYYENLKYEI